ncbi:MAG: helix-turn-helix domain-containing protein [Candidatus Bipolaricaulota bacterium]|nr:helix-turn-helix domain-containing protein [Candidatus Bipolaricaulota bacterium]
MKRFPKLQQEILHTLPRGGKGMKATELARQLDKPLPEVEKHLAELEQRQLVEKTHSGYRIPAPLIDPSLKVALNQGLAERVVGSSGTVMIQDAGPFPQVTFLRSYSEEWRLFKALLLAKLLDQSSMPVLNAVLADPHFKEALYVYQAYYENAEAYREYTIRLGLLTELLNTAFAYAEDLGAFIKAWETVIQGHRDKFLRKFIDYDTREVTKFYIEEVSNLSERRLRQMLGYPYDEELQKAVEEEVRDSYSSVGVPKLREEDRLQLRELIQSSCQLFRESLEEIAQFYREHMELYRQYKHGYKIPLRPAGKITKEVITKTRFDSVFFPVRNPNVPPNRVALRLVEISAEHLVEMARKIHWLMFLIKMNMERKYYPHPDEGEAPLYFLIPNGWREFRFKAAIYSLERANHEAHKQA